MLASELLFGEDYSKLVGYQLQFGSASSESSKPPQTKSNKKQKNNNTDSKKGEKKAPLEFASQEQRDNYESVLSIGEECTTPGKLLYLFPMNCLFKSLRLTKAIKPQT